MIQATEVHQVVLHVNDVQRSKKFYTEILGMVPCRADEGRCFCAPAVRAWRRL
jgi:catechol-2,3-dioxygenase